MGGVFSRLTKHRYHEFRTKAATTTTAEGTKTVAPSFRVSLNHGFGIADVWVDTFPLAEPDDNTPPVRLPIHWMTVMFDRVFLGDPEGMAGTPVSVLFELNRNVHPDRPRYLHLGGGRGAVFFDLRDPDRENALVYRCFRGTEEQEGNDDNNDTASGSRAYLLTEHHAAARRKKDNNGGGREDEEGRGGGAAEPRPHTVYLITYSTFVPFATWTRQAAQAVAPARRTNADSGTSSSSLSSAPLPPATSDLHLRAVLDHSHPTSVVPEQKLVPLIDPYRAVVSRAPGKKGGSDQRRSSGSSSSNNNSPPFPPSLPQEEEHFRDDTHGSSLEETFARIRGRGKTNRSPPSQKQRTEGEKASAAAGNRQRRTSHKARPRKIIQREDSERRGRR